MDTAREFRERITDILAEKGYSNLITFELIDSPDGNGIEYRFNNALSADQKELIFGIFQEAGKQEGYTWFEELPF